MIKYKHIKLFDEKECSEIHEKVLFYKNQWLQLKDKNETYSPYKNIHGRNIYTISTLDILPEYFDNQKKILNEIIDYELILERLTNTLNVKCVMDSDKRAGIHLYHNDTEEKMTTGLGWHKDIVPVLFHREKQKSDGIMISLPFLIQSDLERNYLNVYPDQEIDYKIGYAAIFEGETNKHKVDIIDLPPGGTRIILQMFGIINYASNTMTLL